MSLIVLLTLANQTSGQSTPAVRNGECTCHAVFDDFRSKVEADYVGYHVAVRGKRNAEYGRHAKALGARALRTSPEKCIFVLQDFLRFFRDGHLFAGNSPRLTDDEVNRLTSAAERIARKEDDVRRYLASNAERLDPIEGIWYAKEGYRVGIVRDRKVDRRDSVAIMLSEGIARWTPDQVKAEFRKLGDGSYDVVLYANNHSARYPNVYLRAQRGGAAIRRGLLLHMPPTTWGKAYPLKPNERGVMDPIDPRRPTIRAPDDSTVIVSVPSHSPEYTPLLNSLVDQYRERILRPVNLVIDIRGDEGGSAGMTRALMPFLLTHSKRAIKQGGDAHSVVLSSADNIAYFAQMESQGWLPPKLLERMRANPGKVISFDDPDSNSSSAPASSVDSATPLPRNVAILMDGAVVSAGEAFVLNAMKNEKVTLFGENTGGVIDYQSVNIVNLTQCPSLGLYLGYPTSAASDRLPVGGVNATGIAPDVRIRRNVKDPIRFIPNYYARRRDS